ncbi:MAG: hypothetical protein GQ574_00390 [Crocinitomix sp.]|nr:hypothetical protein [Crocinitomix sp.]
MKNLLLVSFVLFNLFTYAQQNDISLNYRFGFSTQNLTILNPTLLTRYDHTKVQSVYDQGINLAFATPIWEKQKVYINMGADMSQSKHIQAILNPSNNAHLDNIVLNKKRIGLHLGVHKRFSFMDDKLILDIGSDVVYRLFLSNDFSKMKSYSSDFMSNNEEWIEYKYDLNTYHGEYFSNDSRINHSGSVGLDINAFLRFRTGDQSFINMGVNLTTHNIFYYDYNYSINYYTDGVLSSTYTYVGLVGSLPNTKFGIRNTNIYFNLGYTYTFKKKKP